MGKGVTHKQAQMGVNGQKLNFQANGGRWWDNEMETAWNSFVSVYIIATASSDNIFVNESKGTVKGSPISSCKWGKNGQKLNFQADLGRWQNNGVETAWKSFLFLYVITTAYSDDIFVNKSGSGVKGLLISRRKWG